MKKDLLYYAFFAGIMFLTWQVSAQGQGDLDSICGQAPNSAACDIISAQVASQVSQTAPPGVNASCVWHGGVCSAVLSIPNNFGEHNTSAESLSAACARGNSNQLICENISSMISSSGLNPAGVAVSCVWNNPGAANACSEHVVLTSSTITDHLVGGLITGMSFIQNGQTVTQIVVRSDPFIPYYVHVIINGSIFPSGSEGQAWMHVTAIKDITPMEFDFESIDPLALANSEKERITSQFLSDGAVELGPGIGPDFTALKALQTFTWNVSIPYNYSKEFAGVANCNGTFNESAKMCQSAGEPADWINMPECATPGNCPDGSYLKDVPTEGYLTIYNADPLPVYKTSDATTTTTTTTSSTTSTTTAGECALPGDHSPCGSVSLSEVIDYINLWVGGEAILSDVIALINAWAGSL
jgi:hypothetical protein